MISRNKEHDLAMKAIYIYFFYKSINIEKDIKQILEDVLETPYEEIPLFIKEVVIKALLHFDETLELIKNNLIKWKLERINKVTIAILILGISESKYLNQEDLIKPVLIDVCVNLTKRYCGDNEYKFVNGILDKIL